MATVQVHESQPQLPHRMHEEELTAEVVRAGSLVERVGGVATIVLAIVALTGTLPLYLTAIAAITVGLALAIEGVAGAARYSRLMAEGGAQWTGAETAGGTIAEFICGGATAVLGILALLHVVPMVLLPVAVVVLGAGLVFGSGARARLSRVMIQTHRGYEFMRLMAREVVLGATAAELLVGISGAILGILALVGTAPLILVQVALLACGCSLLLCSVALSGRIWGQHG